MSDVAQFATPDELCTRLGIVTPDTGTPEYRQMDSLLSDATGEIRATIGQPISRMTSTFRIWADGHTDRWSYVELPAIPVISIQSVEIAGRAVTDYRTRYRTLYVPRLKANEDIAVTYTHGYDPLPEELVKWTCVLAASQLDAVSSSGSLGMSAGVSQHTQAIDDYSETWANYAGGDSAIGMALPPRVAERLRAQYGAGGVSAVSFR